MVKTTILFHDKFDISHPPRVVLTLFRSSIDHAALPTTWGLRKKKPLLGGVVSYSPSWSVSESNLPQLDGYFSVFYLIPPKNG